MRPDRTDWNPSLSLQTVQVEAYRLCYVVKGKGEPIVLIHGYGAGMWVWEKQMDALSKNYQVFAVDLLGHGFPQAENRVHPETYVRSLKCFMEVLALRRRSSSATPWEEASPGDGGLLSRTVKKLILIDAAPPDVRSSPERFF
jgi:hypothetical protein